MPKRFIGLTPTSPHVGPTEATRERRIRSMPLRIDGAFSSHGVHRAFIAVARAMA
jgi:hypothetical protein